MNFSSFSKTFLILLVSAILIQYHLLSPVFQLGWAQDDWIMRAYYQVIAQHPLRFLTEAIKLLGPYVTQEYYIGILTSLLGPNYHLFRILSFIYKTFVALAIYFLVIKVTKDKLLGLATFALYAISFTSTESIQFIIASTEYLVQLTLCIFLLIYHHLVTASIRSIKWLALFLLTFIFSVALSPIRAFPILVIPFLIEFFILTLSSKAKLKDIFIRLAVLSPVYILIILMIPMQKKFPTLSFHAIDSILKGNWYEVIVPFTGLGSLILPYQPWKEIFGPVTTILSTPINTYLLFILGKPSLIFSLVTFLFSRFLSGNRIVFFFKVILLNYFLQISAFLFYTKSENIPLDIKSLGNPFYLYPAIGGIFIFAISLGFFWEWIKNRKIDNIPLLLLWVGPWFALLVLTMVWLLAHPGFVFTPVHRYLLIAHFGAILFLAALLSLTLKRIFENKSSFQRGVSYFLLLALILIYYKISYQEIREFYSYPLSTGMKAKDNEYMQQRFLQIQPLSKIINSEPSLYYFDTSEDTGNSHFYSRSFIGPLVHWVTVLKQPTSKTCTRVISADRYEQLKQAIVTENNNKVIRIEGNCFDPQTGTASSTDYVSFKPENFYAYKIKDKNFIDIRSQLLSSLGL